MAKHIDDLSQEMHGKCMLNRYSTVVLTAKLR